MDGDEKDMLAALLGVLTVCAVFLLFISFALFYFVVNRTRHSSVENKQAIVKLLRYSKHLIWFLTCTCTYGTLKLLFTQTTNKLLYSIVPSNLYAVEID